MDRMSKLFEKKKKEGAQKLPENEKHAKMSVLHDLKDQASKAMAGKLGGFNKVSVASNDEAGLKHGLEKAKELLEKHAIPGLEGGEDLEAQEPDDDRDEHETPEEAAEEHDDEEHGEEAEHGHQAEPHAEHAMHGEESEEELDEKIKQLLAKKKHLESRK